MIKGILIATDGSEHANAAWHYAVEIARAYNARLRILSVIDARVLNRQAATVGAPEDNPFEIEARMESETAGLLDTLRRRAELLQVKSEVSLLYGEPAQMILSLEPQVDLIVVGHRGHRPLWDRLTMGSVAEAVIQGSTRPVLIAPRTYNPIHGALAAYDASEPAKRALQWAADLTSTMRLRLNLVHVNRNHEQGQEVLREAREFLRAYGIVNVNTYLHPGPVAERVLAAASSYGSDLIVMGAYGESALRGALLGSVTEEVIQKTDLPLLMVR